jgi:hypothetical protein
MTREDSTGARQKDDGIESPDPRNLIRECPRIELDDPPNLYRLTSRQTIEERGVAETQERFAGAGAMAYVERRTVRRRPR